MAAPTYLTQNDADLTRLIKDGAIFIRPEGSTPPTGPDWTPGPTDGQVGYYSEDGFTLTPVPGESTELLGHNGDTLISEGAPGWWTVSFAGLEGSPDITCAYFDIDPSELGAGGSVTVTKASNSRRYDIVTVGLDQRDRLIVAHYPSVQVSDKEPMVFNRTTLLAYGVTFRTFRGGPDTPYHFKAWGMVIDDDETPGD